jgi:hypothetical protein
MWDFFKSAGYACNFTLMERSFLSDTCTVEGATMASEPKRPEPDIPAKKPDIQPEPRPEEIPQDKNPPEKEAPPMQL